MSVAVELTVPGDAFELGSVLATADGVSIEIERVVPIREHVVPYVWASGEDRDVAPVLEGLSSVESVTRLVEIDGWGLYEMEWHHPIDGLVASLAEAGAAVVEFAGIDGEWHLDLRFPSRDAVTAFHDACREKGIAVTVTRISERPGSAAQSELTSKQHEALLVAYERGYFDIPREVTLTDLAEQLGISTQALSQRLRRGNRTLVRESLVEQSGLPPTHPME
jgi:predicted DNA binding protein